MRWRLLALLLASGLAVLAMTARQFLFDRQFLPPPAAILPSLTSIAQPLTETVRTPPPLRAGTDQPAGTLTVAGVVQQTNQQRSAHNSPHLTEQALLRHAAEQKLADMASHQYFAHVGPDGKDVSSWAEVNGYSYLRIGENLALGNFSSDEALVQAWMASPGHRANILSSGFVDIGVAVGKKYFEGQETWLAVQVFGLPRAVCPTPPLQDRQLFEQKKTSFTVQDKELEQLKAKLEHQAETLSALADNIGELVTAGNTAIEQGNQAVTDGNHRYQESGSAEQAQPSWEQGRQLHEEGKKLHQQAKEKQANWSEHVKELSRQQDLYQTRFQELRQLDAQLKKLANQLNIAIQQHNDCLRQY